MSRSALFRVDGGRSLGFGHVKRCLTLASELAGRGMACTFACREGEGVTSVIGGEGFPLQGLTAGAGLHDDLLSPGPDARFDADVAVLDISNRETLAAAADVPEYFAGLRRRFRTIAMIDGYREQSLASRFDLPVDLVIEPYAGSTAEDTRSVRARRVAGPQYFILDPAYASVGGKARVLAEASRILVTAGGSDPAGLTALALQAIELIGRPKLEVRYVVGPAFGAEAEGRLADEAARSRHDVAAVVRPADLASLMTWCDLAISATGLTKYELAVVGVPVIAISIDAEHARINAPFEASGCMRHLGVVGEVPADALASAIEDLLNDAAARAAMSAAGRSMLDGRGAKRVADAIVDVMDSQSPDTRRLQATETRA